MIVVDGVVIAEARRQVTIKELVDARVSTIRIIEAHNASTNFYRTYNTPLTLRYDSVNGGYVSLSGFGLWLTHPATVVTLAP